MVRILLFHFTALECNFLLLLCFIFSELQLPNLHIRDMREFTMPCGWWVILNCTMNVTILWFSVAIFIMLRRATFFSYYTTGNKEVPFEELLDYNPDFVKQTPKRMFPQGVKPWSLEIPGQQMSTEWAVASMTITY